MTEKEIKKNLESNDVDVLIKTLNIIKKSGNKNIIKPLLDLLLINKDEEVQKTGLTIFEDLNEQDVTEILMESLNSKKYNSIKPAIISACWKNNLDFTSYLNDFVDFVLKEDYLTSFDAFTVIENMLDDLSVEQRLEAKDKALLERDNCSEDKLPIIDSLISIL